MLSEMLPPHWSFVLKGQAPASATAWLDHNILAWPGHDQSSRKLRPPGPLLPPPPPLLVPGGNTVMPAADRRDACGYAPSRNGYGPGSAERNVLTPLRRATLAPGLPPPRAAPAFALGG